VLPRCLIFALLCLVLSSHTLYSQCSPSLYYRDNDGDGIGIKSPNSDDISRVITDFNDARTGNTTYSGDIAYGCSHPGSGWASSPGDCNDNDPNAQSTVTWFTDSDGEVML